MEKKDVTLLDEKGLKKIFAKNLTDLMQENGMKQQDLIDALSRKYGITVNQGTVSSWVTARKMPRPIVMERIGNLFGWDIAYMLSDSTRGVERFLNMPSFDTSQSALESDDLQKQVHSADAKHRKIIEQTLRIPIQKLDALQLYLDALDPASKAEQ